MADKPLHFTTEEIDWLNEAINMAIASNKRLQNTRPKFSAVFQKVDADLQKLKAKLNT